jgi:hypothetical protein
MPIVDRYGRSAEERKELQEKVKRANEVAAANWDDPKWRREMAAEMTDTIYRGFQHENLLGLFATVENAGFNDRIFLKEVRGLRAFWIARGGYIEASSINSDVMELQRDTIGFHVTEFTDKLMVNFAETQANLVDLGIQRLDAEVNLRVLRSFQAAIGPSSPFYITGSGLSLNAVNAALREVRDASRSRNVTIFGRATMTDQIVDLLVGPNNAYGAFLPETNEALLKLGVLGTYRGARIITLTNYLDDQDTPFFPANEMYIATDDAAKFGFWGGLMSKEYEEDDNWYWHYLARRDFGGVVHRPQRIRRIVDTSISASLHFDSSFTTP